MRNIIRITALLAVTLSLSVGPDCNGRRVSRAYGDEKPKAAAGKYRSPLHVAISPDGKTAYATDRTSGSVVIFDVDAKKRRSEIPLRGKPHGLAVSADGGTLYVAEHGAGSVAVIDTATGKVTSRIPVGKWPTGVTLAPKSQRLFVCNQDNHTISVIDLSQAAGKPIAEVSVIREPSCAAITSDEKSLVVANLLAYGPGTEATLSAEVSIIDVGKAAVSATVKLPPGSTGVQGVCVSPDGRWAYVVHALGRFHLPITQLERGWVNTFALSIIDIAGGSRLATILLDDLTQGAADPHSVVCSPDGARLWISHAGVHEISMVKIGLVHELLSGHVPKNLAALQDGNQPNVWVRIAADPKVIAELENHLTALYIADAIRRVPSGGIGPRGIALSPDGGRLFVANYFSGSVAVLDAASGRQLGNLSLGSQPELNSARRGEMIFNDALKAFQRWHSCASCHIGEGRVDGLRWDFLTDGMGNAKDTLSLVNFDKTEPLNRRATVAVARDCIKGGLESTNMLMSTKRDVDDLFAYVSSLKPVPSPHLNAQGSLTQAAARGKGLFEGKAGCMECHPAPYYTDRKMHNIGVLSDIEPDGRYDTPSLIEAYRTAPYLHDGRALTVRDVLTKYDQKGQHGEVADLSKQELNDLIEYVLSL